MGEIRKTESGIVASKEKRRVLVLRRFTALLCLVKERGPVLCTGHSTIYETALLRFAFFF